MGEKGNHTNGDFPLADFIFTIPSGMPLPRINIDTQINIVESLSEPKFYLLAFEYG